MSCARAHSGKSCDNHPATKPETEVVHAKCDSCRQSDPFEHEADRVAQRVATITQGGEPGTRPRISRMNGMAGGVGVTAATGSAIDAARGRGQPMDPMARAPFEQALGTDLAGVRVNTGGTADALTRSIGARAFTTGRDIFFRRGAFDPNSRAGQNLLTHELTHVVQQDAVPARAAGSALSVQRFTEADEEEGVSLARLTTPNPALPAPPAAANPAPPASSFDPLTTAERDARQDLGITTDTGQMTDEIFSIVSPTGGGGAPCTPQPANFEPTVAAEVSTQLQARIPNLTPADAPDPMAIAQASADEAMPLIASTYSPHAPTVTPAAFMANVSRTATNFGDPIRNTDAALGEFLEWFSGANDRLRDHVTGGVCGMTRAWWTNFAAWLRTPAGAPFDAAPHQIRERAAVFDTFETSITSGGHVQFGRGFEIDAIPHTVVHEAMHLFQHADLNTQTGFLQDRNARDIFIEGFAEYLARGVRAPVIAALRARTPPALTATQATQAAGFNAYRHYVDKVIELRDTLYRHGQDGEEAIRRAFFLGEGWRFGLLESPDQGSPIETDRNVPVAVDVTFNTNSSTILNPAALDPAIGYLTTRSVATADVVGRTDPAGTDPINDRVGQERADAVKAHLVANGVDASRISTSSRGSRDQIAGGNAPNRRATVVVTDTRNAAPGEPALGR